MSNVIENVEAGCKNCNNWIPDNITTHDGRLLGECKLSDKCVCCNPELIFGGTGGAHFKSTGDFLCKFWRIKII